MKDIKVDIEDELKKVKKIVNEKIEEIQTEIVPEFEQIEEYEEEMDVSHIEDLFDDYETLEFQAIQSYSGNLTNIQKGNIRDKLNNLPNDTIYNYISGIEPNESNIKNNLNVYFGMSENISENLIQFYKDLINSDIPLSDVSKYFWGIQSSMVGKYQGEIFLFTNGDYTEYYTKFKDKYPYLDEFLEVPRYSSESFILLLSTEEFTEDMLIELQKQNNSGIVYE